MSTFFIRSSAHGVVSLLNDEEVSPYPLVGPSAHSEGAHYGPLQGVERQAGPPGLSVRRKYGCEECGKEFTTSGHLTRHCKIHSGEKAFSCPWPNCDKSTARHDNLLQHYRMHLPESQRKETNIFVRALMGELRAQRMGQSSSSDDRAMRQEYESSSDRTVSDSVTPRPEARTTSTRHASSRRSANAQASWDGVDGPSATLTYTSTSDTDSVDNIWASPNQYPRYVTSYARGE